MRCFQGLRVWGPEWRAVAWACGQTLGAATCVLMESQGVRCRKGESYLPLLGNRAGLSQTSPGLRMVGSALPLLCGVISSSGDMPEVPALAPTRQS